VCRILGYVFNPVSFYYCHDTEGPLRCILAEVNNTFGGRHVYFLGDDNRVAMSHDGGGSRYEADKVMHVSPFISMHARYAFHFAPVHERLSVSMQEFERGAHVFDAHLWGRREPLNGRGVARLLLRYPFLTLKIFGAIHFEAARLYLKGAPFYRSPLPIAKPVASSRAGARAVTEVLR